MNLSSPVYCHLVHTLTGLLPPPLEGSPEALNARNHAAIAKVAALLPVNANEADLAVQCVAARAQAEDVLRLIRTNAHSVEWEFRLNAQYLSMVRTSQSLHARLMRVQALRQKREACEATANEDAWTLRAVEHSMLKIADPDFERLRATRPEAAPAEPPGEAPEATPPAHQRIEKNVSQNKTNSHDLAFETPMSDPGNDEAEEIDLRKLIHEATAEVRLAERALSANGRESAGRTG